MENVDVHEKLCGLVGTALSVEGAVGCSAKLVLPIEGRGLTLTVEPSLLGKEAAYVAGNYHYELTADEYRTFDLTPLINDAVTANRSDYDERCDLVLRSLGGGSDAG